MEEIIVRESREDDLPNILDLALTVYGKDIEETSQWLSKDSERERLKLVATNETGKVVGYGTVLEPRETFRQYLEARETGYSNILELGRLFIHPEYRRKGVASELVRARVSSVRERGMEPFALVLEGNEPSALMLTSLGWTLWGSYEGLDGKNLIYLCRT